MFKQEWEKEDLEEGLPTLTRMSKACNMAMNHINPDLQFTVETEIDFVEKRLPTLDFYMWVEKGTIKHSYYEKPMRTQMVLMKRSSMGIQQKMDILSNELIRRLSSVGEGVPKEEKIAIIDHYTKQLLNSGYDRKQTREIIICGIRGYRNKVERRKKAGENFYRKASSTLRSRVKKKLTEKNNWYRKKKKKEIGNLKVVQKG